MRHRRTPFVLALSATGTIGASAVLTVSLAAAEPNMLLVVGALVVLAASFALGMVSILVLLLQRQEQRILRGLRALEKTTIDNRAKASRHEYAQEQVLAKIESVARGVDATTTGLARYGRGQVVDHPLLDGIGDRPRVLFVTSNGGGMGHIARCSAVLRHGAASLDGKILTLSSAADVVRASGADVSYFPSQSAYERGDDRWNRQFLRRLLTEISRTQAQAVVFDGTWVYRSVTEAAEYAGVPLVWLRRGLWRQGVDLAQVSNWQKHATAVISPRDVAEDETNAAEEFRSAIWCDPISLESGSPYTRTEALESLGLDPGREYVLVQLSGGNTTGSATQTAVDAITSDSALVPVIVRSPLYAGPAVRGALTIDALFPLVDLSAAWTYTVTGAGYNSVHENLHSTMPGVYLPSQSTLTDDQARRGRAMQESGRGLVAESALDLAQAIARMNDAQRRDEMRQTLEANPTPNGADRAARHIKNFAREGSQNAWT